MSDWFNYADPGSESCFEVINIPGGKEVIYNHTDKQHISAFKIQRNDSNTHITIEFYDEFDPDENPIRDVINDSPLTFASGGLIEIESPEEIYYVFDPCLILSPEEITSLQSEFDEKSLFKNNYYTF